MKEILSPFVRYNNEYVVDAIFEECLIDVFENKIGIDYQVADSVLDHELYQSALNEAHNWCLREFLGQIGIVIKIHARDRFTLSEQKKFFTSEYCVCTCMNIIRGINNDIHSDIIALDVLDKLSNNDDINIWFKGLPFGNNVDALINRPF